MGRVHEPSFRVVLTESVNATRSGRFKEILGSYDPRKTIDVLKADRIKYWLSKGAQPTETVHNLLVEHKILDAKKMHVSVKSSPVPPPAPEAAPEAPAPEAPVADVVAEAAPAPETPATPETPTA